MVCKILSSLFLSLCVSFSLTHSVYRYRCPTLSHSLSRSHCCLLYSAMHTIVHSLWKRVYICGVFETWVNEWSWLGVEYGGQFVCVCVCVFVFFSFVILFVLMSARAVSPIFVRLEFPVCKWYCIVSLCIYHDEFMLGDSNSECFSFCWLVSI